MSKYKQSNPFPTIYVGILIIASLFAFSPAFTNGFVNWDDYAYIVNNNLVTEFSFANIVKMFTPTTFVVGNYHPLTVLVYSIEHALFGLDPAAYHTVNVMIHLINVLLASLIAWRLLHHRMATLFMTSLFALHPMRVESVVWAAELKDVLYVCFFLGGIYRYIVNAQESREGIRDYAYVYGLFILSLLSKGQAVVFPLILLVVDFTLTRHITKKLILSKVPFFVTSLAFGFLAIAAQRGGQLSVVGPQLVLPFHERLACALYGVLMYFVKFLVPVNLACFYDYPLPEQMGVIFVYAGASASVLITLVWLARRNRMLLGG